jgi:hypothetical protein
MESKWLEMLSQAELDGNPQWGALVAKNFQEDPNVATEREARFRECIEQAPEVQSSDEAARLLRSALGELLRDGLGFDSEDNEACCISDVPFGEFARGVDVVSFGQWNLGMSARRIRKATFRAHVAKRVRDGDITVDMLRGDVGSPNGVWATDREEVTDDAGNLLRADDVRDRLGLDDPGRFGAGEHMVFFAYSADGVPDGAAYRPTVVDTGVWPMASAWLPSDATTHETGLTQHLASGRPACPEVLHRPFPANEVSGLMVSEALATDPSTGYRDIRLAGGA